MIECCGLLFVGLAVSPVGPYSYQRKNVFDISALTNVTDDLVFDVFLCITCMWLVWRLSPFCFVRVYIGRLFRLLQFLVRATIGFRQLCVRYKVYGDCVLYTVLFYSCGASLLLQYAMQFGC